MLMMPAGDIVTDDTDNAGLAWVLAGCFSAADARNAGQPTMMLGLLVCLQVFGVGTLA